MILDSHFAQRKDDVDAHFRCLEFINGVESHKSKPVVDSNSGRVLLVDLQMQCCLKAQTLIILYNMVESTICECLNYIYDAVADDKLTYADLTDKMRNMWVSSCRRTSRIEQNWSEAAKMPVKVIFEELAINTSGSIDIRKIYDIFDKHGCTIEKDKREDYGDSFLTVKNKRNRLAHGNESFSQCGSNYLFSGLDKMRKDITAFLPIVIEATKKFVEDKQYKR